MISMSLAFTLCLSFAGPASAGAEPYPALEQLISQAQTMRPTFAPVPVGAPAEMPEVTLPPALQSVLAGFPENFKNKNRYSVETTLGKLTANGAAWLIERDMKMRFSEIDAWWNHLNVWNVIHLEFPDAAALGRVKPWLQLSLDHLPFFQRDNALITFDDRHERIKWVIPIIEGLGYRKLPRLECSGQSERVLWRGRLPMAPNTKSELTLSFSKEQMVKGVRIIALGEAASKKLSAVLSMPGVGDIVTLDERHDWRSEGWKYFSSPNLFPARGDWKLKLKNDSEFTTAQITGIVVEVDGYSLDKCASAP